MLPEFRKYFPTACFASSKRGTIITLTGLKPGSTIFYFASRPLKNPAHVWHDHHRAYVVGGKLTNSGIGHVKPDGTVLIRIENPGQYVNSKDGKIHPHHCHFVYWNLRTKSWRNTLHTMVL